MSQKKEHDLRLLFSEGDGLLVSPLDQGVNTTRMTNYVLLRRIAFACPSLLLLVANLRGLFL